LAPQDYDLNIRVYGRDGTMGPLEPVQRIAGHELCLIFEVTAPTQDLATTIAGMTRHQALHLPIPEWSGLITTIACPYSPAYIELCKIIRISVSHVVESDVPLEVFKTTIDRIVATASVRADVSGERHDAENGIIGGAAPK